MKIRTSIYFEIKDSEVFGGVGSVGYAEQSFDFTVTEKKPNIFKESAYDHVKKAAASMAKSLGVSEKCVRTISKEEYNENTEESLKIPEWIYSDGSNPQYHEFFESLENALGFKLFVWQKEYILTGRFRRCGETTASILRTLLSPDANLTELDFAHVPRNPQVDFRRKEILKIKEKLDSAGISTNPVITKK